MKLIFSGINLNMLNQNTKILSKKMLLKMLFAKWQPFCLGLQELKPPPFSVPSHDMVEWLCRHDRHKDCHTWAAETGFTVIMVCPVSNFFPSLCFKIKSFNRIIPQNSKPFCSSAAKWLAILWNNSDYCTMSPITFSTLIIFLWDFKQKHLVVLKQATGV